MTRLLKSFAGIMFLLLLIPASEVLTDEAENKASGSSVKELSATQASELIQKNRDNPGFVILDVRTSEEYSQGHIENAVNIDVKSDSFPDELQNIDKNDTYLVHCRSGGRSERAVSIMEEMGFTDIYEIGGGFSEWQSEGLPVAK